MARLAGVADVDPQCLLPQCTVGYLHAEHLVDLHDVLRQTAPCSEEAAGGLHAGQHRRTHIPAADTGAGVTMRPFAHMYRFSMSAALNLSLQLPFK